MITLAAIPNPPNDAAELFRRGYKLVHGVEPPKSSQARQRATKPKETPFQGMFSAAKAQVPAGTVLLFELGDNYAVFGEDAERVGAAIGVCPMRRGPDRPLLILLAGTHLHRHVGAIQRAGLTFAFAVQSEGDRN